ncbi:MAG: AI-2E family transporter [Tissierellia bacterium]|nr:AI-2E family transporter [Tissierellia bacterium]
MKLTKEELRSVYLKLIVIIGGLIAYFLIYKVSNIVDSLRYFTIISRPIILGMVLAFVINILLNGVENILLKKIKMKNKRIARIISIFTAYMIFIILVTFLVTKVIPQFIQTILNLIYHLPNIILEQVEEVRKYDWMKEYIPKIEEYVSKINTQKIANYVLEFLSGRAGYAFSGTINIISGVFSSFFEASLVLIFSIYALGRKERMAQNAKSVLFAFFPEKLADWILGVCKLLFRNFYNFFTGQFIEAILLAIIVFTGMNILGMPYSIMIAVMTGFLNLIPYLGSMASSIIGTVIILTESPIKALIFLIFMSIVQQFDGNFMYPKLVGKKIGIPSFWIIVSITIGGAMFGIMGMVVCVPIMSTFYMLLRDFTKHRLEQKKINIDNK